jgi:putative solute:sodium symporter small subunit
MRADTSTASDGGTRQVSDPVGSKRGGAMFDWKEYPWTSRSDLKRQLQLHRLKNLLLVTLAGWVSYFLGINLAILKLNKIIVPVINLPLGFYLAVQGSIVMFVILLFWFARYERIANSRRSEW